MFSLILLITYTFAIMLSIKDIFNILLYFIVQMSLFYCSRMIWYNISPVFQFFSFPHISTYLYFPTLAVFSLLNWRFISLTSLFDRTSLYDESWAIFFAYFQDLGEYFCNWLRFSTMMIFSSDFLILPIGISFRFEPVFSFSWDYSISTQSTV